MASVAVSISISRMLSEGYPGLVECELLDAFGKNHLFIDKMVVVSMVNLFADSEYPCPGIIACEVEERWLDASGIEYARINTSPWSIESTDGATVFTVLASQLCLW